MRVLSGLDKLQILEVQAPFVVGDPEGAPMQRYFFDVVGHGRSDWTQIAHHRPGSKIRQGGNYADTNGEKPNPCIQSPAPYGELGPRSSCR